MKYVVYAQVHQPTTAQTIWTRMPSGPLFAMPPMPTAALESSTTANAWRPALASASTSS
jgi:hypothetical protein